MNRLTLIESSGNTGGCVESRGHHGTERTSDCSEWRGGLLRIRGAAHSSATVDLIWADTGTDEIHGVPGSSEITLRVILIAGPNGSSGGSMSVDYTDALDALSVVRYASNVGPALPISLGSAIDTGSRIEGINAAAIPPDIGAGLSAGRSYELGTITFHVLPDVNGSFEIRSDANSILDCLLDVAGNDVDVHVRDFRVPRLRRQPVAHQDLQVGAGSRSSTACGLDGQPREPSGSEGFEG